MEDNRRIQGSIVDLRVLQQELRQEAEIEGITEEDLQVELEKVREDMWNEYK